MKIRNVRVLALLVTIALAEDPELAVVLWRALKTLFWVAKVVFPI